MDNNFTTITTTSSHSCEVGDIIKTNIAGDMQYLGNNKWKCLDNIKYFNFLESWLRMSLKKGIYA